MSAEICTQVAGEGPKDIMKEAIREPSTEVVKNIKLGIVTREIDETKTSLCYP